MLSISIGGGLRLKEHLSLSDHSIVNSNSDLKEYHEVCVRSRPAVVRIVHQAF